MYLKELVEELGITEDIDKAVLAALVVSAIVSNSLAIGVSFTDLKHSVIDGVVSEYLFNICNLATSWCDDLADLFCAKISYHNRDEFFQDVIWPYLRRKVPMEGVSYMK